jgi:hypothetical protein
MNINPIAAPQSRKGWELRARAATNIKLFRGNRAGLLSQHRPTFAGNNESKE